MADSIVNNTALDTQKMAMIAAAAQKSLAFKAKLVPLISDYSFMVGKGMKSLDLPKLGEFTATNRATGVAADATILTDASDQMLLNKIPHINFIIDPQDEVQSRLDVQMEYAMRAASSQARFVDAAIVSEIAVVGTADGSTGAITKAWFLNARDYLQGNNADLSQAVVCVGHDSEKALLAIDDFVRYDSRGVVSPVVTGAIGAIYGIPVVVSNAFGTTKYAMFEKGGVAIAFQRSVTIGTNPDVKYGPTAQRWAIEAQFGVRGLELNVGTAAATKSALVYQDGNP